jgi:hypothetical protein
MAYESKSVLLTMEKQTQMPLGMAYATKPILPAIAGKIALSLPKGLWYSILKDRFQNVQYIYGKILTK